MRSLIFSISFALLAAPTWAANYEIQPEKFRARFKIGHNDYAKPTRGRFAILSGEIEYDSATSTSAWVRPLPPTPCPPELALLRPAALSHR